MKTYFFLLDAKLILSWLVQCKLNEISAMLWSLLSHTTWNISVKICQNCWETLGSLWCTWPSRTSSQKQFSFAGSFWKCRKMNRNMFLQYSILKIYFFAQNNLAFMKYLRLSYFPLFMLEYLIFSFVSAKKPIINNCFKWIIAEIFC